MDGWDEIHHKFSFHFFPQAHLDSSLKMMLEHLEVTSGLCALLTAKPVEWGLGVGLTLGKNQDKQNP